MIEILESFTLRSRSRGSQALTPGQILELPDHAAKQLLERARGKVRVISHNWQGAWEYIARVTRGIEETDPRFGPINKMIDRLDECFLTNDWPAFRIHLDQLKATLESPQ